MSLKTIAWVLTTDLSDLTNKRNLTCNYMMFVKTISTLRLLSNLVWNLLMKKYSYKKIWDSRVILEFVLFLLSDESELFYCIDSWSDLQFSFVSCNE